MRVVLPDEAGIAEAGAVIRGGGLAAIPTETVYGLAADAFNPQAVAKLYATKGRPSDNPLILHVANTAELESLAETLPDYAYVLADAFWPGPLTMVVRKKAGLPRWLGGHPERETETVGVRMPNHPVARAVIQAAGCVIAAPSANKAGTPSPTSAAHVVSDYAGADIAPDLLIDGAVAVGIESTVVDVTSAVPVILRPGAVTAEMMNDTLNGLTEPAGIEYGAACVAGGQAGYPRAPGMKYRHYAPNAPMTVLSGTAEAIASYIMARVRENPETHIGALVTTNVQAILKPSPSLSTLSLGDPGDLLHIAKNLFSNLRKFDELQVDVIYAEALDSGGFGAAIMDRLTKAAEGRVPV